MVAHAYYEGDGRVRRYAGSPAAGGHRVAVLARHRGGMLRDLFECRWLTRRCGMVLTWRARRYDVVHVHNMPDFLVFAAFWPRLFGCVVLFDVHGLMPEV